MAKPYQIKVFGKTGCLKCKVLLERLDKLLGRDEWTDFEPAYHDVATEEGLVAFSQAECINPQRIPAFIVARLDPTTERYVPVPNPAPGEADAVCGKARLYQTLGLQTDYSAEGNGIISPKMITKLLGEAKTVAVRA